MCSDREAFVYSKLPYVFFIGFIDMNRPREWEETKVHVRRGLLAPYSLPRYFLEYMMGRARRMTEIEESISDKQQETIVKSLNKNIGRFAGSDTFKAMEADIALFGSEALSKSWNS